MSPRCRGSVRLTMQGVAAGRERIGYADDRHRGGWARMSGAFAQGTDGTLSA